jgi:hypothetical protein
MDQPELRLTLLPSPDDPSLRSPEFQQGLRQFEEFLRAQQLAYSSEIELIEDATLRPTVYFGGFVIELLKSPAVGVIATAVGAWLHAKYGRKVRLKVGEIEVEAQTVAEVETLLKQAEEFQQRNRPKAIHES